MRRPVRLVALALATVLAGRVAPAGAEAPPRTSSLGWVRLPGAEGCIGTRDLALAVEKRLGRAVFVPPDQAGVIVEGYVAPEAQKGGSDAAPAAGPGGTAAGPPGPPWFRAHITLSDAHGAVLGTRDIEAPEAGCGAIEAPLALVIALLIDPDAALGPRRPQPPAPPPPRPPAAVAWEVAPALEPPAPPQASWREGVSVGPAVAAGLLPGAGVALALRGEVVPPRFIPVELGGAVWLDARAQAASGNRGAVLSFSYGMVGLCPLVWGAGGTWVRGCAEAEVGVMRSVGYGFTGGNISQEKVVGLVGVTGRVTRRLVGPLELGVGLGLAVPVDPARFFYADAAGQPQEIFKMAAVAGVVDGSVGLSFP